MALPAGKTALSILLPAILAWVCAYGAAASAGVTVSGDLFIGVWSPTRSRWEATTPVCIWNEDGGAYRVRVSGSATGTSYALADPGGATVDYTLRWLTSGTRGQREQLSSGVASRRTYQFSTDPACLEQTPPHLLVRINDRILDNAPPGIYRDALYVTVEPI